MTKKIFSLLFAVLLLLSFSACGGAYPEDKETEPNTPENPETQTPDPIQPRNWSDFENWYFWGKEVDKSEGELYAKAHIVRNVTALQALRENLTEDEKTKFAEAFSKCDEAYFESHTMVLLVIPFDNYVDIQSVSLAELTKDADGARVVFNLRGEVTTEMAPYYSYCYIALSTEEEIDIDSSDTIDIYYDTHKLSQ